MAEGGSKLSEEHICECLKSLNVPVRIHDVKVPTKEFLVRIFEIFLKDLQIDIGNARCFESTKHMEEEPEIFEEPTYLISLAMAINTITSPQGLNVTLKDIVEPKPKRTKKILNYLVIFWNYFIQKCARFHEVEASFEEEKKKIESLIIENQSLDERYNDKLNILSSMPIKQELSDLAAVNEEKASKLKTKCDSLCIEYQNMKTKEADLRNEISALDLRTITAKQTLEEFDQLILSSPERMKTEIQKLEDKIKIEDSKLKELENKCKENEKKLKLLEENKIEEEKNRKTLEEISEASNHLGETVKGIVSSYQKIDEEDDKFKRLQFDVSRKQESKFQQGQKSAKIFLSKKVQIETLKETLEISEKKETCEKQNLEFIKAAIKEMQQNIDSESDDVLSVIAKCKEASARTKERKVQFRIKIKQTNTDFKLDCDEILEAVRKTFPCDLGKNSDNML